MKIKSLLVLAVGLLPPSLLWAGTEDRSSGITLKRENYIVLPQLSAAPSGNPKTGTGWAYNLSGAWYFEDSAGTQIALATGSGDNTLDDSYDQGGAGAGRTINTTDGAVALTNTQADTAFQLTINASPSAGAAAGGAQITVGANSTQDALEFANSGSGYDIYGSGGTWTISKAGAITTQSDITGDGATIVAGVVRSAEVVTETNVLTAAECGKITFLNSATEFVSTLPAISTVTAGCQFEFVVKAAPVGASYTVITGNSLENVLYGGVNELEVDTGDDGPFVAGGDTITFVNGVSVQSDRVRVITDGAVWYVDGQTSADGGVTLTTFD